MNCLDHETEILDTYIDSLGNQTNIQSEQLDRLFG